VNGSLGSIVRARLILSLAFHNIPSFPRFGVISPESQREKVPPLVGSGGR